MKSIVTISILYLWSMNIVCGQSYPEISKQGKSTKDFIPNQYIQMDSLFTDINGDEKVDFVLIAESGEENYEAYDRPRVLIIGFGDENDYQLAASNFFIVKKAGDGQGEDWSYNFLSGKMKYTKGNRIEDTTQEEKWVELEMEGLILLSSFTSGKEYDFSGNISF